MNKLKNNGVISWVVLLTSLSFISYELILTRVYSVIQWQNLASMFISLALLGFAASGTFLTVIRDRIKDENTFMEKLLGIYPISLILGFIAFCLVPFNPFEVGMNPVQILYIFLYFIAIGVPFFFAGAVIGYALMTRHVGKTYFLNLAGSGLGGVVIILLTDVMHPFSIVIVISILAFLGWMLYSFMRSIRRGLFITGIAVVSIMALIFSISGLNLDEMSQFKSLSRIMLFPESEQLMEEYSPLALIQVVKASGLRSAGDLSFLTPYEVPQQYAIFYDGDAMSTIVPYQAGMTNWLYHNYVPSALSGWVVDENSRNQALIVGVGGGEGIRRALLHNYRKIEGLEINHDVISLMNGELLEESGGIYTNSRVSVLNKDIRGYLSTTDEKYDLIDLSMMDSFAASASGVYALNESYLYTPQAVKLMFKHLSSNGVISITRWNTSPARDNIKMMNLLGKTLEDEGIEDIGVHFFAIRTIRATTIIVSRSPLSEEQISSGKKFARERLFDTVYYPGINETNANRYIKLKEPVYYEAAQYLLTEHPEKNIFIEEYAFDISVPSDNRPYYHNFFKWKTLKYLTDPANESIPFTEWGYYILILLLIPTVILSGALIIMPLMNRRFRKHSPRFSSFLYFSLLGLAFFFVEMPMIQKFILYLNHPIYALSIIIASILIFSGIGSYFSEKIFPDKHRILWATGIITAIILSYQLVLPEIFGLTMSWPVALKILVAVLLLMPMGFFMGIPFPEGLRRLKIENEYSVPWAWGINGFFSVIAVMTVTIFAIRWSFLIVSLIAGGLYLSAGFISLKLKR